MILKGFSRVVLIVGVMTFLVSLLIPLPLAIDFYCPDTDIILPGLHHRDPPRLLRKPLGIPAIMAAAVVIGMGTDYALYLVRAFQRYGDEQHPSVSLIRLSVLLSFATTFIGFVVLALGIVYSYLGTVAFVPPLVKKILVPMSVSPEPVSPGSKEHFRRTTRRFRNMEGYPRLLIRFELRFNPMFPKLAEFVRNPRFILDIGTGYGIPAAWILELFPSARIWGIEPDKKRALMASQAIGDQGKVIVGAAPHIPEILEKADMALLLDILPYLNDEELAQTLQRLKEVLGPKGRLIIRTRGPSLTSPAGGTWLEKRRKKFLKISAKNRRVEDIETMLISAGFAVIPAEPSVNHRRDRWIIAEAV